VLNVLNMVYNLRFLFLSSKCSLFRNYNIFGSCIIHILYTGCTKILKNNSDAKRLIWVELAANCAFCLLSTFLFASMLKWRPDRKGALACRHFVKRNWQLKSPSTVSADMRGFTANSLVARVVRLVRAVRVVRVLVNAKVRRDRLWAQSKLKPIQNIPCIVCENMCGMSARNRTHWKQQSDGSFGSAFICMRIEHVLHQPKPTVRAKRYYFCWNFLDTLDDDGGPL